MGDCLILARLRELNIQADVLYTNPSATNPGATTLGSYPEYKAIIVTSVVDSTTSGTTVFIKKGDSHYGGCA